MNETDWKNSVPYPYKGRALSNPQYIKDKEETFAQNGNGWWWGKGWWNGHHESSMERQRKYREEKENE
tara:strand:- start:118 stop:321 length:204 start_codon:yes stop_codon:yes gene_type:complete